MKKQANLEMQIKYDLLKLTTFLAVSLPHCENQTPPGRMIQNDTETDPA